MRKASSGVASSVQPWGLRGLSSGVEAMRGSERDMAIQERDFVVMVGSC